MPAAANDLLRLHACAFNGRDLESIARQAMADAPCFCDGEWVGEGPHAMREALQREFTQDATLVGRMARLDNEPVILEVAGNEGSWQPRATLHLREDDDGRIVEMRIDHRDRAVRGAVPEPMR